MMRRISMVARDELVAAVADRYARGDRDERGRILDEFAAVTGYHRKHAMRLLRAAGEPAKWSAARPPDLRSGCSRGADPGLGGIRPDLRQTAAAAATDPGRGHGAARPCSPGTGGACQITGD